MIIYLLWILAVGSFNLPINNSQNVIKTIEEAVTDSFIPPIITPVQDVEEMLHKESATLRPQVIDKVITSLRCANAYHVDRNNVLVIIDYSLPSNQKRLWVFDLHTKKLLFYTYVSHGIKSGTLLTDKFSNKNNSKASSLGVYKTEQAYYGREGLSLRLVGLDPKFNDNAFNRYIVMHGGWYMDEQFIKRYGRPGRSWGCPAVPLSLKKQIIETIKGNSLLVIYYPSEEWFDQSKFLNCQKNNSNSINDQARAETQALLADEVREDILYVDLNKNNRMDESDPIVTMSADNYEKIFHVQAPLARMLRRQIEHAEYIALSRNEFNQIVAQGNQEAISSIRLVIPQIIMVNGGYFETQMKIVNLGKIKDIKPSVALSQLPQEPLNHFTVNFEAKPTASLKTTNQFIRWLGL
jgi:hypothetical protein